MAFTQLVAEGNRTGTGTSPSFSVPQGHENMALRLTSTQWAPSTDVMWFAIDRSDDGGGSWREITAGDLPEGARSLDNSMPLYVLYIGGEACQIRARYTITGSMRFGLEYELR
jgi:hypothetical protein